MSTELTMEAVSGLARAVGESLDGTDWATVALVAGRERNADAIHRLEGFVYAEDASYTPTHIKFDVVDGHYTKLIQATVSSDDGGEWVRCLFQAERSTGKVNLAFEFENEDRWRMIPPDWTGLPNEIRPDFSAA